MNVQKQVEISVFVVTFLASRLGGKNFKEHTMVRPPRRNDVTIPEHRHYMRKYCFHLLRKGQSIQIPREWKIRRVQFAACQFGKRHNMGFRVTKDKRGIYRCWRTR